MGNQFDGNTLVVSTMNFRQLLEDADVAIIGFPTKESITYQAYGTAIRDLLYGTAMNLLDNYGYHHVLLSDCVQPETLSEIDKISKVSKGYFKVEDSNLMIAAGHEVNAYLYISQLLRHQSHRISLPIRIYNLGPVYRHPKNSKFPFSLGERKSFLECYAVFKSSTEAQEELTFAKNWNRTLIQEILHIPSVEVLRPISTNKRISKQTTCIDSITPLHETVITGMTYFHDDIFTRALNVKYKDPSSNKNYFTYSAHFGISDHIFFSYLLNAWDGTQLRLLNVIAPTNVSVLNCVGDEVDEESALLETRLQNLGFRVRREQLPSKRIAGKLRSNTLQGIPATVLFKRAGGAVERHVLSWQGEQVLSHEELTTGVVERLRLNDEQIVRVLKEREGAAIVPCDTLNGLSEIVLKGKIARIYCANTDGNVAEVERHLVGGEVLGFQEGQNEGRDIVTGSVTRTMAYVSRRS